MRCSRSDGCGDDVHCNRAIECEAGTTDVEQDPMSSIDNADTRTFEHTERAKTTRVSMLTLDLDYSRACSHRKRQKRTRLRTREWTNRAIEAKGGAQL